MAVSNKKPVGNWHFSWLEPIFRYGKETNSFLIEFLDRKKLPQDFNLVDFYRLKVHSDPLDKKEKYSPDLTPDKMQWYSTETMEKFDMNFYQLIIVDEDDQIKNRS